MSSIEIIINQDTLKRVLISNSKNFGYPNDPQYVFNEFISKSESKPNYVLCLLMSIRIHQCKTLVKMAAAERVELDEIREKFSILEGTILLDFFMKQLFPRWSSTFTTASRNIRKSKNYEQLYGHLNWLVDSLKKHKKKMQKMDISIKLVGG